MPSPPCILEQHAMKRRIQAFSRFLVELLRGTLVSGNARVLVSSVTATPKLPRPPSGRNPFCLRRREVGRRRGEGVWWTRQMARVRVQHRSRDGVHPNSMNTAGVGSLGRTRGVNPRVSS